MILLLLPKELQDKIFEFHRTLRYVKIFKEKKLRDLSSIDVIFILSLCKDVMVKSEKFKEGDYIASALAIKRGILIIFRANNCDVRNYSNKKRTYYIFPNIKNSF